MAVPIIIYFELRNGLLKGDWGHIEFIAGPAVRLRNGHLHSEIHILLYLDSIKAGL